MQTPPICPALLRCPVFALVNSRLVRPAGPGAGDRRLWHSPADAGQNQWGAGGSQVHPAARREPLRGGCRLLPLRRAGPVAAACAALQCAQPGMSWNNTAFYYRWTTVWSLSCRCPPARRCALKCTVGRPTDCASCPGCAGGPQCGARAAESPQALRPPEHRAVQGGKRRWAGSFGGGGEGGVAGTEHSAADALPAMYKVLRPKAP